MGQRGGGGTRKCGPSCRRSFGPRWQTKAPSLALVQSKAPSLTTAEQFYKANLSSFWSQVCLTSIDVSVPGPGRHAPIWRPAKSRPQAVAAELTAAAAGGTPPTVGNGARYCLTPEQLIVQPLCSARRCTAWRPGKAGWCRRTGGTRWSRCGPARSSRSTAQVASVIGVGGPGGWPYGLHVARSGGHERHRPQQDPEGGGRQGRPGLRFVDHGAAVAAVHPAGVAGRPGYPVTRDATAEGHGRGPRPRPAGHGHRRIARWP